MSKILAIDLGKNNSAVCIFDRDSLKSIFRSARTRKQPMHDLFVELYERYANVPGFPDFETYLESDELAETRAAITARRYTGEPRN